MGAGPTTEADPSAGKWPTYAGWLIRSLYLPQAPGFPGLSRQLILGPRRRAFAETSGAIGWLQGY